MAEKDKSIMRGITKWILLVIFAAAAGWLIFRGFRREQPQPQQPPANPSAKKELSRDHLGIKAFDSLLIAHPDLREHPLALIFFNPDCEFCQREGKTIADSIELFKNDNLVFLAADTLQAIRAYADTCGLTALPSVYLIKASNFDVFRAMGAMSVPHLVLFGADGVLRREFDGETNPSKIKENLY
jgi:peroxiredoxin